MLLLPALLAGAVRELSSAAMQAPRPSLASHISSTALSQATLLLIMRNRYLGARRGIDEVV